MQNPPFVARLLSRRHPRGAALIVGLAAATFLSLTASRPAAAALLLTESDWIRRRPGKMIVDPAFLGSGSHGIPFSSHIGCTIELTECMVSLTENGVGWP